MEELRARSELFGEGHPESVDAAVFAAWAMQRAGHLANGERLLRGVLEKVPGGGPLAARLLVRLGAVLTADGRAAEAEKMFSDAEKAFGADGDKVQLAIMHYERSVMLLQVVRYDEAARTVGSAVVCATDVIGEAPHPFVAKCLMHASRIYEAAGDRQKALRMMDETLRHAAQKRKLGDDMGELDEAASKALHAASAALMERAGGGGDSGSGSGSGGVIVAVRGAAGAVTIGVDGHTEGGEGSALFESVRLERACALPRLGRLDEGLSELAKLAAAARARFGPRSALVARPFNEIAAALIAAGRYDEAVAPAEEALRLTRPRLGPGNALRARAVDNMAKVCQERGEHERAYSLYAEVVDFGRLVLGESHAGLPATLSSMGCIRRAQGRLEEAVELFEQSARICRATMGENHANVAVALSNMGIVRGLQGRHEEALRLHRESLAARLSRYGPDSLETAVAYAGMGKMQRQLGEHHKSLQAFMEAARIHRMHRGAHPETTFALNNVAHACTALGRFDDALNVFRETLGIIRKTVDDDNAHEVAVALNNMGVVYCHLHRYPEAVVAFSSAVRATAARLGAAHRSTKTMREALDRVVAIVAAAPSPPSRGTKRNAQRLFKAGKAPAAYAEFTVVLSRRVAAGSLESLQAASIINDMAVVCRHIGKDMTPTAEEYFREALAIRVHLLPPDDPLIATTRVNLALLLKQRGALAAARRHLLDARPVLEAAPEHAAAAKTCVAALQAMDHKK